MKLAGLVATASVRRAPAALHPHDASHTELITPPAALGLPASAQLPHTQHTEGLVANTWRTSLHIRDAVRRRALPASCATQHETEHAPTDRSHIRPITQTTPHTSQRRDTSVCSQTVSALDGLFYVTQTTSRSGDDKTCAYLGQTSDFVVATSDGNGIGCEGWKKTGISAVERVSPEPLPRTSQLA